MKQISIRYKIRDGFVEFNCERVADIAIKDSFDLKMFTDSGMIGVETGDFGPDHLPERTMGPAALNGEVPFIKVDDRLVMCRITDGTVCGHQTWTPTPDQSRFIDASTADAERRIEFCHEVIRNNSLRLAVENALAYQDANENIKPVRDSMPKRNQNTRVLALNELSPEDARELIDDLTEAYEAMDAKKTKMHQ